MPRYPNFEPSIDDCLTIKITYLHQWGHLRPGISIYNVPISGSETAKR